MLKVGDYVRTKYGIIAKITDIIEDFSIDCDIDIYYEYSLKDNSPMMEIPYNLKDEYIIKSSPNIIDLLEVGDVLSFKDDSICRIIEISDNGYYLLKDFGGEQYYERKEYIDTLISIVTKEQFESIQYKVGEKQC